METDWERNEKFIVSMKERYGRAMDIRTKYWCSYMKENKPIGLTKYCNKFKYKLEGKKNKIFLITETLDKPEGSTKEVKYEEYDGSRLVNEASYKKYLDAEINLIDSCIVMEG